MWRASEGAVVAAAAHAPGRQLMIVLEPLSHPELGAIHIHDNLFAIGRTEPPFDGYAPEIVADLSRRHARVFCENGAVYLADLDSKNGTTVNGSAVKRAIATLHDGDQLGLGSALSYRVQVEQAAAAPQPQARLLGLSLVPEHRELGLQAIVVSEFPFLVSKADDAFARYKQATPEQLNYLSRRHAHIFLKGGLPFVEDLGSTNGTFVNGARLSEHAVALHEGDLLGFGGHHFVYRVSMQWEARAPDPTLTRIGVVPAPVPDADADKTTFVAAADSFLDIFCVDQAPAQDDAPDAVPVQDSEAAQPQDQADSFAAQLLAALGVKGVLGSRRARLWGGGALLLALLLGWSLWRVGAPEREVQALLDSGAYARAAAVASGALADDPGNVRLRSLGTAALLKAYLPAWMASLKAHQFARAAGLVANMKLLARHDPELTPLVGELEWMVRLESFVAARGGAQAPLRGPADAAAIAQILKQWEDDNEAHQRAFVTMASYVPAFRDAYADALSDVRKLALAKGQEPNEPITP